MIEKINPEWIIDLMVICACIMIPLLYFILPALWFELSLMISSALGIRTCWRHPTTREVRDKINNISKGHGVKVRIRTILQFSFALVRLTIRFYICPSMLLSAFLYMTTINAIEISSISEQLEFSVWRFAYDLGMAMLGQSS